MSGSWLRREFPNLKESDHTVTSEATEDYNCLAWAAHDNTQRWDPDELEQYYWPPGVRREVELGAFKEAFRTIGFEDCDDASLEAGIEKVAFYATANDRPTHVARQLEEGNWTSKLGYLEDIEHINLECLNGEDIDTFGNQWCYGRPVAYMKRRRPPADSAT